MDTGFDFRLFFHVLKKNLLWIILITVLSTGLAFGITMLEKPVYASTAEYLSINVSGDLQYTSSSLVAAQQDSVSDYIEIIKSDKMLLKVADTLEREYGKKYSVTGLEGMITPSKIGNTSVFTVTVRSTDPKEAEYVVRAISDNIRGIIDDATKRDNSVDVLSAGRSAVKVSPGIKRNVFIGFAAGFIVSVGIFFLVAFFDRTVRSEEDLKKRFAKIPVIGVIPSWNVVKDDARKG